MTTLTDYVKSSTGFTESTIAAVMNSAIAFISTSLRGGEQIKIDNLGIFKIVDKPERQGRNPRTGEQVTFKASRTPKIKFFKNFLTEIQPDPSLVPAPVPVAAPTIPPIPAELLSPTQPELVWQIKAPDGSFIEVATSELAGWGVTATTPIYSPATGWKLAGKVPELAGIVG